MAMTIGKRLRTRRLSLGMGVKELAARTDVAEMTIRAVEGDAHKSRLAVHSHRLDTLARIARVLGLRMEVRMYDERTGEEVV